MYKENRNRLRRDGTFETGSPVMAAVKTGGWKDGRI